MKGKDIPAISAIKKSHHIVKHLRKNGHPPSPRWLPTIQRTVIHHSKDGHPPSRGWVSHNAMISHLPMDCHPPLPGGSPTIPQTVPYYPQDGHPLTQGQSSTILRMVIQHLRSPTFPWVFNHHIRESFQPYKGWSSSNPQMVTHNPNNCHTPSPW